MAHKAQIEFCELVKVRFPDYFRDTYVLDCGSRDINGNNRYLFKDCFYLGVDISLGKNVHIVSTIHELPFADEIFDVVVSSNTFELDKYWQQSIPAMCRMLKPNGLMFFTCSRNWPEHGTARTHWKRSPTSSIEGWENYYRNIDANDVMSVIDPAEIFSVHKFSTSDDGKDLFFWGIKR